MITYSLKLTMDEHGMWTADVLTGDDGCTLSASSRGATAGRAVDKAVAHLKGFVSATHGAMRDADCV